MLTRFQVNTPRVLTRFVGIHDKKRKKPFLIRLLNGLMIVCGPLQAMQLCISP